MKPKKAKKTKTKNENIIRFRAAPELKKRLLGVVPKERKGFSQFMRDEMWKIVDREEKAMAAQKTA